MTHERLGQGVRYRQDSHSHSIVGNHHHLALAVTVEVRHQRLRDWQRIHTLVLRSSRLLPPDYPGRSGLYSLMPLLLGVLAVCPFIGMLEAAQHIRA